MANLLGGFSELINYFSKYYSLLTISQDLYQILGIQKFLKIGEDNTPVLNRRAG